MMRIFAVELFYAGHHRQFLVSWIDRSEHDWTVLGLPRWNESHTRRDAEQPPFA